MIGQVPESLTLDAVIQGGALVIVAGTVWQFFRVLNGSLTRLARAVELNTRAIVRMLGRLGDQITDDADLRRIAEN